MCSSAPDTSGMNAAAVLQAQLSKEQLDFTKQVYADTAPDRAAASDLSRKVSGAQLEAMDVSTGIAKENQDYQTNTFRPLEKSIVKEAAEYDTPERRAAEAATAIGAVGTQADAARANMRREAESRGVDPSSPAYMAAQAGSQQMEAAQKAAAGNAASKNVETIAAAKKADAAGLGRNLASNQATAASLALSQGNSSVGNAQVPLSVASNGANMMNAGFSGAGSLNSSAAGIYGNIAGVQASANSSNDALMGTIGSVAGRMAFSDKHMKTAVRGISPERALAAINKTPVSKWKYKSGSPGDDGGKTHVGPMAQDVRKNMGDRVAPGGKAIDLVSSNGVAMAAIQALSKKVDRLSAKGGMRRPS